MFAESSTNTALTNNYYYTPNITPLYKGRVILPSTDRNEGCNIFKKEPWKFVIHFFFFVRSSAVADISISGFPVTFMTGECMRGPSTHSYCTYTRLIYVPTGTVLRDNRSYHASIKDCFSKTLRTRSTVKSGGTAHISKPCVVVSFSFSIYVFHTTEEAKKCL